MGKICNWQSKGLSIITGAGYTHLRALAAGLCSSPAVTPHTAISSKVITLKSQAFNI